MKKEKKFNCKKGARAKVRREDLLYVLAHDSQKVGIEEYRNSRKLYGTRISGNGKFGFNVSFDDVQV